MLFLKAVVGSIVAGSVLVGVGIALSSHFQSINEQNMSAFKSGRDSRNDEIKEFKIKIKDIEREMKIVLADNESLEKDNEKLTAENSSVKAENARLNKQQANCETRRKKGYIWCEV